MSLISLGPFITPTGLTGIVVDGFVDTGYCIEFSGDDLGLSLPLFRQVQQWRPKTATFDDYYLCGEHLCFKVQSDPYNCVDTEFGKFIRLDGLYTDITELAAIYKQMPKLIVEAKIEASA